MFNALSATDKGYAKGLRSEKRSQPETLPCKHEISAIVDLFG